MYHARKDVSSVLYVFYAPSGKEVLLISRPLGRVKIPEVGRPVSGKRSHHSRTARGEVFFELFERTLLQGPYYSPVCLRLSALFLPLFCGGRGSSSSSSSSCKRRGLPIET